MAKISSTITANDSMSAVLNRVADAVDRTVESFETLNAASQDPVNADAFREASAFIEGMGEAFAEATGDVERANEAIQVTGNTVNVVNNYYGELEESAEGAGKSVEKSGDSAEKAESKFSKLGKAMKVVGAASAAAIGAIAGASIKLGKDVVDSFGELQQNLGGSEAVFGKYAANIQKTGTEAYKNLGVSQSEYLANANKMGALFQGSGLSQAKSAEMTTKAMQRAADMASVMGIETSAAMEAITGAAKGNYTMMDNLGVKMDATTLEAYAAAQKLDKKFSEMDGAEKADLAMQYFFENTKQYADNFANEAVGTISGSMGMLKASYQDLIAGLGNPDADVKALADNVITSATAVVDNILPVVENIVKAFPDVASKLVGAIENVLPDLLEQVTSLFDSVLGMLIDLLPNIIPPVITAVINMAQSLIQALPRLATAAVQIVVTLVNNISSMLPQLIPVAIDAIVTLVQGLVENLPMILDAALQLIMALAEGLLAALPDLIAALPAIITGIVDFLLGAIPQIISTGIDLLGSLLDNIGPIIAALIPAIQSIIYGVITALISHSGEFMGAGIKLLVAIVSALPTIIAQICAAIPQIVVSMIQNFLSFVSGFADAGKQLIMGLWNGINNAVGWVVERIKGIGSTILGGLKSIFKEHSPSKATEEMGINLDRGLANGITYSAGEAVSAAQKMANRVLNATDGIGGHMGFDAAVEGVTTSVIETKAYVAEEAKLDEKDMELMQEIAEREAINKFTTKKVNVDFSGMNNNFTSDVDGEDWFRSLRVMLEDALDSGSEGGE